MSETIAQALEGAVRKVTADWKNAKRRADKEDRVSHADLRRLRYRPIASTTIRQASFEVMKRAYKHASSDGRYLANARQIMYAARPMVLELTGGDVWKDSSYFTQTLLKDYIEEYNPEWAAGVVWDARGHLREPHTGHEIGLGGAEVAQYVKDWTDGNVDIFPTRPIRWDVETVGPTNRFAAALFIEKEGFDEILSEARLAERYDLAIMSTKGVPVGAACKLVGQFNRLGVRVLVLHDFDLAGFKILNTLREGTRLAPGGVVEDLGLRLGDVKDLQTEPVSYRQRVDPKYYLRRCGATSEECQVLVGQGGRYGHWEGERVELNAMTSEQLIAWLEDKLRGFGVEKVVPALEVLTQAYQRAIYLQSVEREMAKVQAALKERGNGQAPADLGERINARLNEGEVESWDQAIWQLASEQEEQEGTF